MALKEQSGNEIVKMIVDENAYSNTNVSDELTNSTDKFLENNPIEIEPTTDQLENIISESEIETLVEQPVTEISENEINRDLIEIEPFVVESDNVVSENEVKSDLIEIEPFVQQHISEVSDNEIMTDSIEILPLVEQAESIISKSEIEDSFIAESEQLGVTYCEKCQPQVSECDPCKEESSSRSYILGEQICRNDLPIAYIAPGRIDICGGIKSFIVAEFIYWEQLSDQLDIGTVNITSTTPQEFEILKFKTDYQPGFKVGIGTHFKRDDWDFYVQYTRLHKTENTIFDPSGKTGTFFTPWFHLSKNQFTLSTITTDIKATWKIDLDKIDLELGRACYLGSSLILRPFVSLSGHRLDQRYDLSLRAPDVSVTILNTLYSSSTKNDSWSIGPRFGFSTNWFFYKGFNLFGNLALSLLFAENEISGSGDENLVIYNVKKIDKYIVRNVEEARLGLGWGSYFTNNKWHFNLSAAYEVQRYSHTNYMSYAAQINLEVSEVKPGDLFLHGLSVATRFDF